MIYLNCFFFHDYTTYIFNGFKNKYWAHKLDRFALVYSNQYHFNSTQFLFLVCSYPITIKTQSTLKDYNDAITYLMMKKGIIIMYITMYSDENILCFSV